jgi:hypothetical protein
MGLKRKETMRPAAPARPARSPELRVSGGDDPRERRRHELAEAIAAIASRDNVDLPAAQRRAVAARPELYRPQLDSLWALVEQAEAWGVVRDLSAEDRRLASRAWNVANLLVGLVARLDAGGGDEARETHEGRSLGTIRDWVTTIVDTFEGLTVRKRAVNRATDEAIVALRSELQALFSAVKRVRKRAPRNEIGDAFMHDLDAATAGVGVILSASERGRVRSGPLTALLDGSTSPALAANDATAICLGRTYGVAPDAVREGAKERLAREPPTRPRRSPGILRALDALDLKTRPLK